MPFGTEAGITVVDFIKRKQKNTGVSPLMNALHTCPSPLMGEVRWVGVNDELLTLP
jgi:hypothetical protein